MIRTMPQNFKIEEYMQHTILYIRGKSRISEEGGKIIKVHPTSTENAPKNYKIDKIQKGE